jgi:hypothetical protein
MVYVLIFVGGHLAFWLLRSRLGVLYGLAQDSVRLVDGMLEPGDGDEKLEALENQTARVLVSFLQFLMWAGVSVAVMLALPAGADWAQDQEVDLSAFGSIGGLIALSVGGTLGLIYPKGKPRSSAYSPINQLLHRLALDNPNLHRRLHEREVKRWRKQGGQPREKFVLVTGLARAGTTSLMQRLLETEAFSSLHYGNMPFVLAPGTWARFHAPKSTELKERSHGDGILVGATSAEALEEPFFRLATGDGYISESALIPHELTEDGHKAYLNYQGLVRQEGKTYLAKNNNALLRYPGLRALNREFVVVMMFREPMVHAASLLAMQRRYTAMQEQDPFVKTYMDWLAHHEFGLGHKPFRFEFGVEALGNPDTLDYWLDRWVDFYTHALEVDQHRMLWVSHEMWSGRPVEVLQAVMAQAELDGQMPKMEPHQRKRFVDEPVDAQRKADAEALYSRLVERALHLD